MDIFNYIDKEFVAFLFVGFGFIIGVAIFVFICMLVSDNYDVISSKFRSLLKKMLKCNKGE